jgi:MFS family permease
MAAAEKATVTHIEGEAGDCSGIKEIQQELQASRQGGYIPISAEEKAQHRALNRKLDLYLVPFCALIYLFNGLDRSNLGNAQTGGFTTDLNMPASAINTATSLFFATYVPLQPVSASLGKKVGQSYWLGIIGLGWGILTFSHAWVKTEAQLIAVRLLIGVFEAGFYPTVVSYMSLFYPRYDLAFRIALFYGSYAIAGAFGGIIAYGCFKINGSLLGWQYLFIVEGACSIVVALVTPFWLAKSPGTAWFLKPNERAYADNRMVIDSTANSDSTYKLSRRDLIEALCDWKLWLVLPFNILSSIPPQGFTIFFPLVVKVCFVLLYNPFLEADPPIQGLGYSGPKANLMTVPPYVIGAFLLLCFAFSSDHFRNRLYHILVALVIVMVGLILTTTLPLENTGGRYAGLVILLAGTFIASPITAAWLAGNTPEPGKRTVVIGINGWGNLAGIIGSQLFLAEYGPTYHKPLILTLILVAISFVGYTGYRFALQAANNYKAKKVAQMTPEEIEEENTNDVRWADRKYTFVYGL